ncbi:unnamed protein product [Dovyalis caffra]|uniref:Uncharacterized protein n=1 Tax=Dovyalis caffra TaxID=77055 RepID=A0AAV1RJM4_9ROSI|nr:unnamed protein product [Dovyalis caffra]
MKDCSVKFTNGPPLGILPYIMQEKPLTRPTSSDREPLKELDDKFKAKRSLRPQRVEGIRDVNLLESKQHAS